MRKIKSNIWISLIIISIILVNLHISETLTKDTTSTKIELKAWADKLEMGFDEQLIFTVQAVWMGELNRFNVLPIKPPECKLFEILGSSSINETKIIQGKSKTFKTFNFILKPSKQGQGEIGSVEFGYVDPMIQDTSWLFSQPVVIQIGPPVKKESGDTVIYLVLILLIFFTSLTYFVIRKREKESKGEKPKTEEKVEISLEEKTLRKLTSLESLLDKQKAEEFYSKVYRLLTGYLEEKYHIITSGKTTSEIINSLFSIGIEEKRIKLLESILKICDLVKFSKESVKIEEGKEVLENFKSILEQSQ